MIKTDRKAKKRGALLASLQSVKPGECFYTHALPKGVTAFANIYSIKVQTEVCLVLTGIRQKDQRVERITKVTIL